jgi:hypothetical protein
LRKSTAVLLPVLVMAAPAVLHAQRGHDLQVHALGLAGGDAFVGGGLGGGLRFGRSARVALLASGGWLEGNQAALRAEVLATFHLTSVRPQAPGVYAGGGVAGLATADDMRGYMVLVLGVEARPLAGGGVFAEVGVGGGVRLSAGLRIVKFGARRR